jgi:hypothetical protein
MAEIGIPLLLILIVYVFYIFTKPYPPREKSIFLDYTKTGAKIPGMRTQKSKKRRG